MPRGGGRGGGEGGAGRGRKKNHKGQRRMFTDEESLREQKVKDEKAKAWRRQCGIESSDEEDADAAGAKNRDLPPSGSDSDEESSEEEARPSGVSHLIQVENPNRTGNKAAKKISELAASGSTTLSRREREELEKQEAKRKYQALHAAGKTDEAQADLARLAIIRKQREDAAKKRDEEKAKEAAAKTEKS